MEKVSPSWHLVYRLDRLHVHLHAHPTISFIHVRREANKVADCLVNTGMECGVNFRCDRLIGNEEEEWAQQCSHLETRDLSEATQMDDQMVGRTDGVRCHEHTYTWTS